MLTRWYGGRKYRILMGSPPFLASTSPSRVECTSCTADAAGQLLLLAECSFSRSRSAQANAFQALDLSGALA